MISAKTVSKQGQYKPQKTKICSFFQANKCTRGVNCKFAHSEGELELAPDLTKTSICWEWKAGTCPQSAANCRFAHGKYDLRQESPTVLHDPTNHLRMPSFAVHIRDAAARNDFLESYRGVGGNRFMESGALESEASLYFSPAVKPDKPRKRPIPIILVIPNT